LTDEYLPCLNVYKRLGWLLTNKRLAAPSNLILNQENNGSFRNQPNEHQPKKSSKTSRLTSSEEKSDLSENFYRCDQISNGAGFGAKIAKKGTATLRGLQPASGLKLQNRFLTDEYLTCLNVYKRLSQLLTKCRLRFCVSDSSGNKTRRKPLPKTDLRWRPTEAHANRLPAGFVPFYCNVWHGAAPAKPL
jgi:hypothetical protein